MSVYFDSLVLLLYLQMQSLACYVLSFVMLYYNGCLFTIVSDLCNEIDYNYIYLL